MCFVSAIIVGGFLLQTWIIEVPLTWLFVLLPLFPGQLVGAALRKERDHQRTQRARPADQPADSG